jgi:hypothetical protein
VVVYTHGVGVAPVRFRVLRPKFQKLLRGKGRKEGSTCPVHSFAVVSGFRAARTHH